MSKEDSEIVVGIDKAVLALNKLLAEAADNSIEVDIDFNNMSVYGTPFAYRYLTFSAKKVTYLRSRFVSTSGPGVSSG